MSKRRARWCSARAAVSSPARFAVEKPAPSCESLRLPISTVTLRRVRAFGPVARGVVRCIARGERRSTKREPAPGSTWRRSVEPMIALLAHIQMHVLSPGVRVHTDAHARQRAQVSSEGRGRHAGELEVDGAAARVEALPVTPGLAISGDDLDLFGAEVIRRAEDEL